MGLARTPAPVHPGAQRLRHEWHNILRGRIRLIRSGDPLSPAVGSRLSIWGGQKPSAAQTQTASGSSPLSTQATDVPTPTPADTAPERITLLNASLPLPSTCTASGPVSFSGGQASLSFGGFARIEDPSATYVLNGTPTTAVALTCNGGGSAAFPSLAFYDDELSLVASYDLSRISDAESYEPVITSLESRGDILHVEWSNEKLPTDTAGMHTGSGTGSADLSWNGTSFDKSNITVRDAQGNQVG